MRAGGAEMRVQTRRRRTSCQMPRHYTPPPVRARAGLCTMLYPPSQRLVSARPSPRRIAVIAAMSDQRRRRVARVEIGERVVAVLPPSVTSVSPRRTSCSGCSSATPTASLRLTSSDRRRRADAVACRAEDLHGGRRSLRRAPHAGASLLQQISSMLPDIAAACCTRR